MRSPLLLEIYNTPSGIQVCIAPPHQFAIDHQQQFLPDWDLPLNQVILVLQQSSISLKETTAEVGLEKNRLRAKFIRFGSNLIFALQDRGFKSDLFDPRTGYPLLASPGIPWDDNAVAKALLNYPVRSYQNCSLLTHPVWKNNVYPATIVTSAAQSIVELCLRQIIDNHNWKLNS